MLAAMSQAGEQGRFWPPRGPRWAYILGAVAVAAALVLLSIAPSGSSISTARAARLIDETYNVSGTTCRPASNGRDLCVLSAPDCHGTLLIAATSTSTITIIDSSPGEPHLRTLRQARRLGGGKGMSRRAAARLYRSLRQ